MTNSLWLESSPPLAQTRRRSSRRRSGVLLSAFVGLTLALLLPSSASAYIIYFLDGSKIEVREGFTIENGRALVTKLSGETTTIDASLIDQERTQRNNVGGLSGVIVIDTEGTHQFRPGANQPPERETLREAIASGRVRTRDLSAEATNSRGSGSSESLPQTIGGYPDLQQVLRDPLGDNNLETELTSSLRAAGLSKFRIYRGSSQDRLMVEIGADGRFEVFSQLEALANSYTLASAAGNFSAVEVLMLNKNRIRSGQFVLTNENAPLLSNGILTPGEFFVQFVQF